MSQETVDTIEQTRRAALRLLARREHTGQELKQKLTQRGCSAEDIESVITLLAEKGLQSDVRFIDSYVNARRNHGEGPLRIEQALRARGISRQAIAEQLDIHDNAWNICAQKAWQKKFKGAKPTDKTARAKQMRYLQYKGFTREQIDSVFNNIM